MMPASDITVEVAAEPVDVAGLLDVAWGRVAELEARGYTASAIAVPSDTYDALASAHADELHRQGMLFLLGLELRVSA